MSVPVPPGRTSGRPAEELPRPGGPAPAATGPAGVRDAAEVELVDDVEDAELPEEPAEKPEEPAGEPGEPAGEPEERGGGGTTVAGEPAGEPPAAEEPAPAPSPYELVLARLDELLRLRRHDVELVDRLHSDNARLRQGELAEAMAPLLRGLLRLHDQMTSLGADDPHSVAGILRNQLLQTLDLAADVRPYTAVPGMPFDPARHTGLRRVPTEDAARDGTIARTVKPGFVRGGVAVVRPAEVEVFRLDR